MDVLGSVVGLQAHCQSTATELDSVWIGIAEHRIQVSSKEARIAKRQSRLSKGDASTLKEGSYYDPKLLR